MMSMKMEYELDGLCCANCAAKIEKEVSELSEVREASLNLMNKKLSITAEQGHEEVMTGKIKKIVAAHEPDVKVIELTLGKAKKDDKAASEEAGKKEGERKEEKDEEENPLVFILRLTAALLLVGAFSLLPVSEGVKTGAFILAFLISGYDVLIKAGKNISRGQIFDENFLMGVASLGAFLIGEQLEAVSVLIFYGIGEFLQDLAVNRSRKNIAGLMDIRPDYANLKKGDSYERVSPEQVVPGDIILVKPGEKIPLDGIVVSGSSCIDSRALTGESVPVEVTKEDTVLSGAINVRGVLEILVAKSFGDSTVARILELVQNSGSKKAESEKFITRFARYYTPAVVFTAVGVGLFPPMLGFGSFTLWIYRALSFLIISCPCALVISIPLSFFGGIGGAARRGILIKGGNYLDALNHVETVVFDKTGTLTEGVFAVTELHPASGWQEEELLKLAVIAEYHSTHPIAKSLIEYYEKTGSDFQSSTVMLPGTGAELTLAEAAGSARITERAGYGMIAELEAGRIYAGNSKLMKEQGIHTDEAAFGSVVHVAWNETYLGYILISDRLKAGAAAGIAELKSYGVRQTVMLTGDHKNMAEQIARQCGIDSYHADLLPQDKVDLFEKYKLEGSQQGKTVFVGDGINDAPVLACADVGIAMGGVGSDAAIEAADIVIMNDDIGKLGTALRVAKKTRRIVMQNIIFALGTKLAIMLLAFLGITSIWFAIFADVGVALLALANSMRAMYVK
jgi:Cd2+/Zn2+-exporting ATPase